MKTVQHIGFHESAETSRRQQIHPHQYRCDCHAPRKGETHSQHLFPGFPSSQHNEEHKNSQSRPYQTIVVFDEEDQHSAKSDACSPQVFYSPAELKQKEINGNDEQRIQIFLTIARGKKCDIRQENYRDGKKGNPFPRKHSRDLKHEQRRNENNQKLIEQIQSVKENQKEVKMQEEENVKILVEQFIQEINTLRSEIKELKDNQNVSRAELLEKIDNMKYEEKLNEINEKLQEKETKNNIISFETLKRKKSNKKVFNINEESIGFEDLQRLSNCIVDLNDEVTSLEAMSN